MSQPARRVWCRRSKTSRSRELSIPGDGRGLMDQSSRQRIGRRVARVEMRPAQHVKKPCLQIALCDRPSIVRHLESFSRIERIAALFGKPDRQRAVVGKAPMRGEPEIERLARRVGGLDLCEILRLLLQRSAERGQHQVVKALLPFRLGFRRVTDRAAYAWYGWSRNSPLRQAPAHGAGTPRRLPRYRKTPPQEIIALRRALPVHMDADDRRIAAGNDEQFAAVVARRKNLARYIAISATLGLGWPLSRELPPPSRPTAASPILVAGSEYRFMPFGIGCYRSVDRGQASAFRRPRASAGCGQPAGEMA
jgi:hypothetical protein